MNDEQIWGEDTETRYPTTEHIVTVYCGPLVFDKVGERLKACGCKLMLSRNDILSTRYKVLGIPNILQAIQDVSIIAWS